jgi:hypothetical protein
LQVFSPAWVKGKIILDKMSHLDKLS